MSRNSMAIAVGTIIADWDILVVHWDAFPIDSLVWAAGFSCSSYHILRGFSVHVTLKRAHPWIYSFFMQCVNTNSNKEEGTTHCACQIIWQEQHNIIYNLCTRLAKSGMHQPMVTSGVSCLTYLKCPTQKEGWKGGNICPVRGN